MLTHMLEHVFKSWKRKQISNKKRLNRFWNIFWNMLKNILTQDVISPGPKHVPSSGAHDNSIAYHIIHIISYISYHTYDIITSYHIIHTYHIIHLLHHTSVKGLVPHRPVTGWQHQHSKTTTSALPGLTDPQPGVSKSW